MAENKKEIENKRIRKQVVIGIFQFFGWILLGLFLIGIVGGILYVPYSIIKDKGYQQGMNDYNDFLINTINEQGTVNFYDKNGDIYLTLEKYHYCDPCAEKPDYCKIFTTKYTFFTGNSKLGNLNITRW